MPTSFECARCGNRANFGDYVDIGGVVEREPWPGDPHTCSKCGAVWILTNDGYRAATEADVASWSDESREQIAGWVRGAVAS